MRTLVACCIIVATLASAFGFAPRNQRTVHGIGLDWDGHWNFRFGQLKAEFDFAGKKTLSYDENPTLWMWLHIQKENLRRGVMRQDRRQKLADLGFQVDSPDGSASSVTTGSTTTVTTPSAAAAVAALGLKKNQQFFPPTPPSVSLNSQVVNKKEFFSLEKQLPPKPPVVSPLNPQAS